MSISAVSSDELWDMINAACLRMDAAQEHLWESIRITPQKWLQHPYGNATGGFWVVGLIGETVIWYNEIEEGFNRSTFKQWGRIEEYRCNQDELEWTVQQILNLLQTGYETGPFASAPLDPLG